MVNEEVGGHCQKKPGHMAFVQFFFSGSGFPAFAREAVQAPGINISPSSVSAGAWKGSGIEHCDFPQFRPPGGSNKAIPVIGHDAWFCVCLPRGNRGAFLGCLSAGEE